MQIKDIHNTGFRYQGGLWVVDSMTKTADNADVFIITNVLSGRIKIVPGDIEVEPVQTVYTD